MKLLGIDPGLAACGLAIVELGNPWTPSAVLQALQAQLHRARLTPTYTLL